MAERVVDEVAQCLLEPQPVAAHGQSGLRLARERPCRLVGPPLEARHDGVEQRPRVDALDPQRQPAAVVASDQEQVVRELR